MPLRGWWCWRPPALWGRRAAAEPKAGPAREAGLAGAGGAPRAAKRGDHPPHHLRDRLALGRSSCGRLYFRAGPRSDRSIGCSRRRRVRAGGHAGGIAPVQASLWAIDSVGLVIASSLLALKYFRAGEDVVAGGFLVFAIGEGVLLSGTAAGPSGSVPAFAAGTALWAAALALRQRPQADADLAANAGGDRGLSLRPHLGLHLRRRGTAAHLGAPALLRLSVPRGDPAGLGLDTHEDFTT